MNQPINDGGPAFPLQSIGPEFQPGYSGMTLRDYFAAAALQGILSEGGGPTWDVDAKCAYAAADAMLKAREESK